MVLAFPVWVIVASALALWYPPLFTWFTGPLITIGLGVIMLGMGLTLTLDDFKRILKFPHWVFLGVLLQYTVMPALGWGLGYLFGLPTPFAVGLILVSCCPGGTASNVISFLARANVALSVSMTAISTFLAVILTPLLTTWLVGNRVEVDALGLFLSACQVVLLPVTVGVLLNTFFHKVTEKILPFSPFAAVLMITLIVASIIGKGKEQILESGFSLIGAVWILHLAGFILGFVFSYLLTRNKWVSRTVSIEVGMQNSGLGVVLARQNFVNPLVAIPSAISSLTHCIIGSVVAALWRRDAEAQSRNQKSDADHTQTKNLSHRQGTGNKSQLNVGLPEEL
jgi:bile acid:Na+ symporter, BASS family